MYVITPNELWILYNKKNNLCKDMKLVEYCRNLEILNKLLGIIAYMTYHKLLVNLRWWTVMSGLWVLSLEVLQGKMKILVKFILKENFVKILLRKKKNRKKRKLSWDEKLWMCNVHYIWYWNWFKIFKSSSKKKPHFTHAGWLEVSKLHGEFYSVTAKLEYLFLSHVTFSLLCC